MHLNLVKFLMALIFIHIVGVRPSRAEIKINQYDFRKVLSKDCKYIAAPETDSVDTIIEKMKDQKKSHAVLDLDETNWFNCSFINDLPSRIRIHLKVKNPLVSNITFYIYSDEILISTLHKGENLTNSYKQKPSAGYTIPIQMASQDRINVLIQIKKPYFKGMQILIESQEYYQRSQENSYIFNSMIIASLFIVTIITSFLIYMWKIESHYILNIAHFILIICLGKISGIIPIISSFFLPGATHYIMITEFWIAISLLHFFVLKVIRKDITDELKTIFLRLNYIITVSFFLIFFVDKFYLNILLSAFAFILLLLNAYLASLQLKLKNREHAIFILIASSSLLIIGLFSIASSIYPLSYSYFELLDIFLLTSTSVHLIWCVLSHKIPLNLPVKNFQKEEGQNQVEIHVNPDANEPSKLYQKERIASLGTLTNGLAQELNNPLAIIAGHQYRLNAMITNNNINISDFKLSLVKIGKGVKRVLSIIDALKAYSQDDTGKLEFEEVNIRETVQYSLDLCRERLNSLGIKLITQPIPDAFIKCSQGQIMQVLLILINNAIEAVGKIERKEIIIEYQQSVTEIRISVIDTGSGILPSLRDNIFDPFFTTESADAKGLGLSIANGIVTHHHGKLYLDPDHPQTKFVICLPR